MLELSSGQHRDLIIVAAVIGASVFVYIYWFVNTIRFYGNQAVEKLTHFAQDNGADIDKVTFFTTGHPVTWSEASKETIISQLKSSCWNEIGPLPSPKRSRFLLNFNTDRNAIYVVFTNKNSFDWGSLIHLDEYIKNL